jgi:hypothetical protein
MVKRKYNSKKKVKKIKRVRAKLTNIEIKDRPHLKDEFINNEINYILNPKIYNGIVEKSHRVGKYGRNIFNKHLEIFFNNNPATTWRNKKNIIDEVFKEIDEKSSKIIEEENILKSKSDLIERTEKEFNDWSNLLQDIYLTVDYELEDLDIIDIIENEEEKETQISELNDILDNLDKLQKTEFDLNILRKLKLSESGNKTYYDVYKEEMDDIEKYKKSVLERLFDLDTKNQSKLIRKYKIDIEDLKGNYFSKELNEYYENKKNEVINEIIDEVIDEELEGNEPEDETEEEYEEEPEINQPIQEPIEGTGIKDAFKRIKNIFTNTGSVSTDKAFKTYGQMNVIGFSVHRTPVEKAIKGALNAISLGKFNEYKNKYDDLYHLYIILQLIDNSGKYHYVLTEKRPQIEWEKRQNLLSPVSQDMHIEKSFNPVNFTLMLQHAINEGGGLSNYFKYTAEKQNCQQWVISIINSLYKINNMPTPSDVKDFVLQDVNNLITGHTKSISKGITDIGSFFGRVKQAITGGKLLTKQDIMKLNKMHWKNNKNVFQLMQGGKLKYVIDMIDECNCHKF